jgi:hypothetical protein
MSCQRLGCAIAVLEIPEKFENGIGRVYCNTAGLTLAGGIPGRTGPDHGAANSEICTEEVPGADRRVPVLWQEAFYWEGLQRQKRIIK